MVVRQLSSQSTQKPWTGRYEMGVGLSAKSIKRCFGTFGTLAPSGFGHVLLDAKSRSALKAGLQYAQ